MPLEDTPTDRDDLTRLMDEVDCADFLNISERTLQNWRQKGGGPPFVRLSRRAVRYRKGDLIAWCEERLTESTAEYAGD